MSWKKFGRDNPHIVKAFKTRKNKHKFGAVKTERDGFKFDSKLEARYYDYLKVQQSEGHVVFFLMQTRFHLEGNVTYAVDFQVFYSDGSVRFIDVKGRETKAFIRAKKQVEARYPVDIEVVKDGEF